MMLVIDVEQLYSRMSFNRKPDDKVGQKLISYQDALSRIHDIADSQAAFWRPQAPKCSGQSVKHETVSTKRFSATSASGVPLVEALGRKPARRIVAPNSTPHDDTSAMDGFAVCSAETLEANEDRPLMLRVIDTIAAGDEYRSKNGIDSGNTHHQNICAEIMTGACFPGTELSHLDAVVKVEDVTMVDWSENGAQISRCIRLTKPVKPFQHRRPAGSDFREGDLIVDEGEVIKPKHIAALASHGFERIEIEENILNALQTCQGGPCRQKLKIGVLSTGSEVKKPGVRNRDDGTKQSIPDSNGPYLTSTIRSHCPYAVVDYLGVAADDEEILTRELAEATSGEFDIVISSGGVSMGRFDLVRHVIETRLKGEIVFHGAAIRPGAPIMFAKFNKFCREETPGSRQVAFFGAPGNPLAAAVALQFFVLPYISGLMVTSTRIPSDKQDETRRRCPQRSACNLKDCMTETLTRKKPRDMTVFWLATEHPDNAVEILDDQASYKLSGLLKADCWVILPAGRSEMYAGDLLEVRPL